VPQNSPASFYEACVFQKILIFALRITKHDHITFGRFDQYMYPYFRADLDRGVSREALFETLELYFLSLNMDADTYLGMQAGDNGQSMVLGGYDAQGNDLYNELSQMCMEASLELEVIDPKINLRVSKQTPDERYLLGTRLTKKGLGFPQYCNDDVVVPGLIKLGYDPEDAVNYTVAACWEYIIPGKGVDIPNMTALNFPLVVREAIVSHLEESPDFETLMQFAEQGIVDQIQFLRDRYGSLEKVCSHTWYRKSPLMSLLIQGCMESGKDFARFGGKYYNFGCHGTGISTAADSLAAVKKLVYDEQSVDKQTLLAALEKNFEGYAPLRNQLLACPKMGSDDDYADGIGLRIMDCFAKHLNGAPNGLGGIWRAGTGSAMEYVRRAKECPATPDGRLAFAPYGCSFSPSLEARPSGPLSTVLSFTKYDLSNIINGGPLTMELHDNVFRNEEGVQKVAALVKLFVLSGGHQLQLNAINRERLLDAQQHPENYPNLVVRVWGWSGYFRELDPAYQNHIIQRTQFTF
jgi:formate C-acetyltransferase